MSDSMAKPAVSLAVNAYEVAPRIARSVYPEPFASRMDKRTKTVLGAVFGLQNFGVNLTRIAPGGESALMHRHAKQDEFIYIIEGTATLVTDVGERTLGPNMCAGFAANGVAHQLVNRSDQDVVYLEIGDRTVGDQVEYPNDDLRAVMGEDGAWRIAHKDGTPY
jgi:uncharacterized cupin superfamily protein